MIRIICKNKMATPDGETVTEFKTFVYALPELEEWLEESNTYVGRAVVGAEVEDEA
jgi:hypothetical protein